MAEAEQCIEYINLVEKSLIVYGFTPSQAINLVAHWRRDPNPIIFTFSPEEWYYTFIDQTYDLQCNSYHIYSYVFGNMLSIQNSKKVGCIECGNIYDAKEISTFVPRHEGQDPSAVCKKCGATRVVGDYDWLEKYGKSREWFEAIVEQAYTFWSSGRHPLIDKTDRFYA